MIQDDGRDLLGCWGYVVTGDFLVVYLVLGIVHALFPSSEDIGPMFRQSTALERIELEGVLPRMGIELFWL